MQDPYSTTEKGTSYYQLHPITPPPPPEWTPRKYRKTWLYTALLSFVATIIVLLTAIGGVTYWTSHQQEVAPTPDVDLQMNTGEFDVFIRAFAQAMADKKYDAIKNHTSLFIAMSSIVTRYTMPL